MIRVGITGGIGSGKTTFCKTWETLGAFVVYADDLAKELMVTDAGLIRQIKSTFGEQAYLPDGRLNRAFLADEAFAKNRVHELNGIVHPRLWQKVEELSQQKEKEGVKVFAEEAAILLQNGRPEHLDVVILLISEEEERIERVVERDNTLKPLVLDRIQQQPRFEELAPLADYLVVNNGTREELNHKAEAIYRELFSKTKN